MIDETKQLCCSYIADYQLKPPATIMNPKTHPHTRQTPTQSRPHKTQIPHNPRPQKHKQPIRNPPPLLRPLQRISIIPVQIHHRAHIIRNTEQSSLKISRGISASATGVDIDDGCAEEVLGIEFRDGGRETGLDCWEPG